MDKNLFPNKISAVTLSFNEGKNINSCLESISWVDEVVIIDTGSLDNTIDIANKFTCKIYHLSLNNNYALLRVEASNKIQNNWIIMVDADEKLSSNAEKGIKDLIKNKNIDGYWFPRRNYINDKTYLKHGYFYPDYQLRLFRNNGKIKYSGRIHEQPVIPKEKTKIINDIEIIHNPSHTKWGSFLTINRFYNYVKIEGEELAKDIKKSTLTIFKDIFAEFSRHFYRSFLKLHGYKDGYPGFRAAVLYGLYKAMNQGYAFYLRLKSHD